MFFNVKAIAGAVVISCASFAAQAATFDFSDLTGGTQGETLTIGAITVTVTADGGLPTLFSNGAVGVGDGGVGPGTDVSDLISGTEKLTFSFDPTVDVLNTVVFESGKGTDKVVIVNEGNGSTGTFLVKDPVGNNAKGTNGQKLFSFDIASLTGFDNRGDAFSFFVKSSTGTNRGIAVKSLTVSEVPLPASLPLLAAGFGGLALMKRRKKA